MVKYLLFDCMETLVDLHDWQGAGEDARWAFEGRQISGKPTGPIVTSGRMSSVCWVSCK